MSAPTGPAHRRLLGISSIALAAALILAGCASTPDLSPSAAADLQQQVLRSTLAAEVGDDQAALDSLDAALAALESAADDGSVTSSRYRDIAAAAAVVRTRLEGRIAAKAAEAAQAQADEDARNKALAEQQAELDRLIAEQDAADDAAPEPNGPDQTGPADPGAGGNGKDKDKGNGKGKDKG
jgi:hypothetical protein